MADKKTGKNASGKTRGGDKERKPRLVRYPDYLTFTEFMDHMMGMIKSRKIVAPDSASDAPDRPRTKRTRGRKA